MQTQNFMQPSLFTQPNNTQPAETFSDSSLYTPQSDFYIRVAPESSSLMQSPSPISPFSSSSSTSSTNGMSNSNSPDCLSPYGNEAASPPNVHYRSLEDNSNDAMSKQPEATHNERRTIYVGNLPPTLTSAQLQNLFEPIGHIVRLKLAVSKATGTNVGFGFVEFADHNCVQKALGLNGAQIFDKKIKVAPALPPKSDKDPGQTNLYICNLPLSFTKEELVSLFEPFGQILGARLLTNELDGSSRGVGFVRLDCFEHATNAIKSLHGTIVKEGCTPIVVKFASESTNIRKPGRGRMPMMQPMMHAPMHQHMPPHMQQQHLGLIPSYPYQGMQTAMPHQAEMGYDPEANLPTNVCISNLPASFTKQDLDGLVIQSTGGRIVSSRLLMDDKFKNQCIGFVRMDSHKNAQLLIQALNGMAVAGSPYTLEAKFAYDNNYNYKKNAAFPNMDQQQNMGNMPQYYSFGVVGMDGNNSYGQDQFHRMKEQQNLKYQQLQQMLQPQYQQQPYQQPQSLQYSPNAAHAHHLVRQDSPQQVQPVAYQMTPYQQQQMAPMQPLAQVPQQMSPQQGHHQLPQVPQQMSPQQQSHQLPQGQNQMQPVYQYQQQQQQMPSYQ